MNTDHSTSAIVIPPVSVASGDHRGAGDEDVWAKRFLGNTTTTTVPRHNQRQRPKYHFIALACGFIFLVQFLLTGLIYNEISSSSSSFSPLSPLSEALTSKNKIRRGHGTNGKQHQKRQPHPIGILSDNSTSISSSSSTLTSLKQRLDSLELEIAKATDPFQFMPFMIRDARRVVPNFPQHFPYQDFQIFDYIDVDAIDNQDYTRNSKLFVNGMYVQDSPCQKYSLQCYKQKIIQVLEHLLKKNSTGMANTYYFYLESDNELCVPVKQIKDLAFTEQRYFISTGIGFSGWIMSREFLEDFYKAYNHRHKHFNEGPDPIGATLLMEKKAWSVTRQYLVSHTLVETISTADATTSEAKTDNSKTTFGYPKRDVGPAEPLTVGRKGNPTAGKHLPRCFEPRRGVWPISDENPHDLHGWDYFDYDLCPTEAIFPCQPGQLEEVTKDDPDVHVSDTLIRNGTSFFGGRKGLKRGGGSDRRQRMFGGGDNVEENIQGLRKRANDFRRPELKRLAEKRIQK